jgi:acetyl-CoA synthetase
MWDPPASVVEAANSTRFARAHGLASHAELLRRSLEDPAWFWDAWARYLPLAFDEPYDVVLDESRGPEWARWFTGGRLNLVESCVHRHARGERAGRVAIVAETEAGTVTRRTYAELAADVARAADGLASLGVQEGDRVALVMPMSCELVTAYYAIAHLGAVSVPIFSGFSASAIASRLVDAEVVCVVTADGSERRGRFVPVKATVDEAVAAAPSVRHVVVHRHAGADVPWREGRDVAWANLLAGGDPARARASVESEHPLMVAYTSGTTGRPKGAVHVHAGFLAKIAQEVWFHADLREGDALHWATDMGWIMGPWETVGTHAAGQTLVLYDGAPDFPDPGRLWRFAADHGLAFCGVSPTLIRALQGHGAEHARAADLSRLRAFGSTGEPWNPEPYRWLFEEVGDGRRPIINISGGTEIGAVLVGCDVTMRLDACSLGGPALGMAVEVWDAAGQPVTDGSVGELVCTRPWPSMTRGIWNDPDRYLATYWSRWPGVWVHGDWASVAPDGQWFLHGRSDDTLNVAGKRIGPAEYESALVAHPAVVEACAIGVPHDVKGETAWCYVLLAPGVEPSDELRAELARAVEDGLGKAFRPGRIAFARALPRTRSAKIVRRAVRAVALGEDPGDLSTLEDPAALEAVRSAS